MTQFNLFSPYVKTWILGEKTIKFKIALGGKRTLSLTENNKTRKIPLANLEGIPEQVINNASLLIPYIAETHITLNPCGTSYRVYVKQNGKGSGNIQQNSDKRWPGGIVYYYIAPNFPADQQPIIQDGIDAWNDVSAQTGHELREATPGIRARGNYIEFTHQPQNASACAIELDENNRNSPIGVGMKGGRQLINCASGKSLNTRFIMHEIGHAIGLLHEHQRGDSDDYVKLNYYDPIWFDDVDRYGDLGKAHGPYDFSSIMHYPVKQDLGGGRMLSPKSSINSQQLTNVGVRSVLSEGDIAAARRISVEERLCAAMVKAQEEDYEGALTIYTAIKNNPLFLQTLSKEEQNDLNSNVYSVEAERDLQTNFDI